MNLYLISQDKNLRWDTYDSAVVCANSEEDARIIHPDGRSNYCPKSPESSMFTHDWTTPANVQVKLIGVSDDNIPRGVVCASFNAG